MLKKRSVLRESGQLWAPEDAIREAGYDPALGTLVSINGMLGVYELASRVVPFKVGLHGEKGFVWWLLPVHYS